MQTSNDYYPINRDALFLAMRRKGFRSVEHLAQVLGLHRNTIGNYLQGSSAIPKALGKILDVLEVGPKDIFEERIVRRKVPGLKIEPLIETLLQRASHGAFVLFGSRARGTAKQFSDYDLGVYTREEIGFSDFSKLLTAVDEFNSKALVTAQLTNLSRADSDFLRAIGGDLFFLGGSFKNWIELLGAGMIAVYE